MSFEKDITDIKKLVEADEKPVFRAASQEEIANRPDPAKEIRTKLDIYVPLYRADGTKATKDEIYNRIMDLVINAGMECQIYDQEIQ